MSPVDSPSARTRLKFRSARFRRSGQPGESMSSVREEGELDAGIDDVWRILGDFPKFVEAMGIPVEVSGDGVGATLTVAMEPSPTIERVEKVDNETKTLQYSLIEGALLVENYLATIQLSSVGSGR